MKNVTIYTRSLCVWCLRAKFLLWQRGIAYEERDASDDTTRAELLARTGRKTVPQVFFGDESIGGFDDLRALDASGHLSARLGRA
jgi:glutaredoxin 3